MSVPAKIMKRLKDPAQIELQPLEADPRYQRAREELVALESRYRDSERRRDIALARARGQQPTRSALDRAKALVDGGQVIILPPAAELEASDEELFLLTGAIVRKREQLAEIAAEASFEVCQRFAAQNAEALRAALDAATALFYALEAARLIRGRIVGAGFSINESALPIHNFPVAAAVGDPDRVGMTAAALFKQWLQEKGII